DQTRAHLIKTAYQVFSEKGILAMRMSDIAQAADVSHGTVFLHFETQEALITEVVSHYCGRIAARTHELSDACCTLRELLTAHLKGIGEYEPFYTRLVIENRLLPQGARDAWVGVQSAISLHFSRAAVLQSECADKDSTLLFNTWMGMVHYYIVNSDLYAPEGGVVDRYGERLVDFFMCMATGKANGRA
ncbi:MAG: TetR/AcrR family transcriptional regulator, partial [Bacillota bacterium]